MARIIESSFGGRRIIKLSTDDILSVIRDYQRLTAQSSRYKEIRNILEDTVIYLPEDFY